eukprot:4219076-Prymnesium_polylepis.1
MLVATCSSQPAMDARAGLRRAEPPCAALCLAGLALASSSLEVDEDDRAETDDETDETDETDEMDETDDATEEDAAPPVGTAERVGEEGGCPGVFEARVGASRARSGLGLASVGLPGEARRVLAWEDAAAAA